MRPYTPHLDGQSQQAASTQQQDPQGLNTERQGEPTATHIQPQWEAMQPAHYQRAQWCPKPVRHDGPHEPRADREAALPVVTSGTVVADKHAPLQRRHEPTPLRCVKKSVRIRPLQADT